VTSFLKAPPSEVWKNGRETIAALRTPESSFEARPCGHPVRREGAARMNPKAARAAALGDFI